MTHGSSSAIVEHRKHRAVDMKVTASAANKSSLARALKHLHASGLLNGELGAETSVRRRLQKSTEEYARTETPYGPVVKFMTFEGER